MQRRIKCFSRLILLSLLAALITPHWALADAPRAIELNDGSRLSGVIVDYGDGTYTIESETLGRLQLRDEQIRSIHSPESTADGAQSLGATPRDRAALSQLEQIQNRIMADPKVLPLVISLQQDPDIVALLNDPQVMQAILSGQIDTLQDHPKIHQLESNPTIQKIMRMLNQ
jgi:hypothetical protein